MTLDRTPMTVHGAKMLREELEQLKTVERPAVIDAIAEARAHGDLKENAEYHSAREKQGFVEGRIAEIDSKLGQAQVIDVTEMENTGRVIFGTTVTIINLDNDQETTYRIVGEDEANIEAGLISYISPIARGLIGKEVGDIVDVKTPAAVIEYEIAKVEYV